MQRSDQKFYTGVGSRQTPPAIQDLITRIAAKLESVGYILRSGAAEGADQAFERGVTDAANKQIFIAWNGFCGRQMGRDGVIPLIDCCERRAFHIASEVHPAWGAVRADGSPVLNHGAKALHARNTYQVLGARLDTPSKFLICWAPVDKHGVPKGGTRTAWVLAERERVECFNLFHEETVQRFERWLKED